MPRACILGTGFAVPDRVVTNQDLSSVMDTTDEWIRARTGIEERRWVREGETGAQLALCASNRALEAAGIPRDAFSPTFAVSRIAGWCAHVDEQRRRGRLMRPLSKYVGPHVAA